MDRTLDPLAHRPLLRFARNAAHNWLERHQHPGSFWLHMLGVPLTVIGVMLLFALAWEEWYWGVGLFVLGYFLQLIGHLIEGNDMGEWAAIKRMLGLPYVAISPRWQKKDASQPSSAA